MLAWGPRLCCVQLTQKGSQPEPDSNFHSVSSHMLTWYPPWAAAYDRFQGRGQYDPQLGEELTGHERNSREAEGEERENEGCEKLLSREDG